MSAKPPETLFVKFRFPNYVSILCFSSRIPVGYDDARKTFQSLVRNNYACTNSSYFLASVDLCNSTRVSRSTDEHGRSQGSLSALSLQRIQRTVTVLEKKQKRASVSKDIEMDKNFTSQLIWLVPYKKSIYDLLAICRAVASGTLRRKSHRLAQPLFDRPESPNNSKVKRIHGSFTNTFEFPQ